jgi:hypothetical protein
MGIIAHRPPVMLQNYLHQPFKQLHRRTILINILRTPLTAAIRRQRSNEWLMEGMIRTTRRDYVSLRTPQIT